MQGERQVDRTRRPLWRVLGLLRGHGVLAGVALGLALPIVAVTTTRPLLLGATIDSSFTPGGSRRALAVGAGGLGVLAVVDYWCTRWRRSAGGRLAIAVQADLRRALARQLLTLDAAWYERARTGPILASVNSDVDAIRAFVGFGSAFVVIDGLTAAIALINMSRISVPLTIAASLLLVPALPLARRFNTRLRKVFAGVQARRADMTATVHDTTAGFVVVKTAGVEARQRRQFVRHAQSLLDHHVAAARLQARFSPLVALIPQAAVVASLWLGGRAVIGGTMSLGQLIAFNAYVAVLAVPIAAASQLVSSAQRAAIGAQRVLELLDARPTVVEHPCASDLVVTEAGARVELDGVRFRALRDVTLTISPGERVAVVGPTGSGKSSLAALLGREHDPESGHVRLDGIDVATVTLSSLRATVAVAHQDPFLLAGTVRQNVVLDEGPEEPGDDEIRRVLHAVDIIDLIDTFPHGLDQPVGDRGHDLSGGQRQRLALARAILRRPRLLVLDGALSEIDAITETVIYERLPAVLGTTTTVVLGSRPPPRLTGRVLRLGDGRPGEAPPPQRHPAVLPGAETAMAT